MSIRVALAMLPPFVREIVGKAVSEAPDMEIVAAQDAAGDSAAVVFAEARPDVLIVPSNEADTAKIYHAAMIRFPPLKVLEIDSAQADLFEVRLLAENAGIGSLLDAIRTIADSKS